MKRIISALALVAFSVVACGDDDDGGDNTGGNAGTGATTSDAGEPASSMGGNDGTGATGGGPPTMNVACDPELDGVCQNPMDCPFVESGEAREAAGACGLSCLLVEDPECPVDCMLMEKGLDMSSECADCYGDAATCGIMECAAPCMTPESAECQECLMESGCRETFNECSGLEQ
jgi:hypothetical protein